MYTHSTSYKVHLQHMQPRSACTHMWYSTRILNRYGQPTHSPTQHIAYSYNTHVNTAQTTAHMWHSCTLIAHMHTYAPSTHMYRQYIHSYTHIMCTHTHAYTICMCTGTYICSVYNTHTAHTPTGITGPTPSRYP